MQYCPLVGVYWAGGNCESAVPVSVALLGLEPRPSGVAATSSALTLLVRGTAKAQNLTLDTIARRSGLSIGTVGNYHSGLTTGERPRPETLRKLAQGLGIPVEDLFEAAGIGVQARQMMVRLFEQLPTDADREQALATLRAHVTATRRRQR